VTTTEYSNMHWFLFLSTLALGTALVKDNVVIRGSTAPFPDFDPLGLSEKKDVAYLREAELKHGRWAMLGASSIPLTEMFTHRPAIHAYDELALNEQLGVLGLITAVEFHTMLRGWVNPREMEFTLKDDYQPGDLGLGLLKDKTSDETGELMDKELNNGRLAMIAFMGMVAQELVSNAPLLSV
jgi:light-harvesting complex I chlorophyll a/b binding protein 4